ncbi:hypothetical protein [Ignatzschineria sp. LJL83]
MSIERFNNERFELARPITPVFPTGQVADEITLYVKSVNCEAAKEIVKAINTDVTWTREKAWETGKYVYDWDKRREQDIDLACSLLEGFTGLIEYGTELVFNEENKRRLMTEYDWLRNQVLEQSHKDDQYELKEPVH